MKPPTAAPAVLGLGVVGGVAAMLVGIYRIHDCLAYRTGPGQCDHVVEDNVVAVVGGISSLASAWGGFNTLNRKLREEEAPPEGKPAAAGDGPQPLSDAEVEATLREAFRMAVKAGVVPAFSSAAPPPPLPPEAALDAEIIEMARSGYSQREIAEELDISRYRVRKALQTQPKNLEEEA